MRLLPLLVLPVIVGCASTEEKVAHNEAQIRMVAVQREAQKAERQAEAEAQKELYRALLGVAQADPSQSGVVAMALAFQGVQGGGNEKSSTPIVGLQARQNEALQWAQALAPVAGSVLSTVGTAIISGNVQKRQIEATRDVQINQANQTANAIASVADLGAAAVANVGDSYSGDYYSLTDSAIDNSTATTSTTTSTTIETATSIADSYNTDNSVTDYSDNSDNSTTDNTDNSYITYGGQQMTLQELIDFFRASGESYSITIGESTYTDTDQSDESQTCVPTFDGYVCT
ncbi:MAG: hypothetical protein VXA09_02355 [Burkholderiaceae bacterium]